MYSYPSSNPYYNDYQHDHYFPVQHNPYYCYPIYYNFADYYAYSATSYLRILHASPGAPAVDIYVNNNRIVTNLPFGQVSGYVQLAPGVYNVEVYPTGQQTNPVIETGLEIRQGTAQTIAATGTLENIGLQVIPDTAVSANPSEANIRFVHLSPNTPAVDVKTAGGQEVFNNIRYEQVTNYQPAVPANYTLDIYPAGTNRRILQTFNVNLRGGRNYTLYAIGKQAGTPPLQTLVVSDGAPYGQSIY